MPNIAPDGPLETEQKGLLSVVGDPVGQVLDKGLSPVGHVVGAVGNPNGQALTDAKNAGKKSLGLSAEDKKENEAPGGERIGGNAQTGQNPLGL